MLVGVIMIFSMVFLLATLHELSHVLIARMLGFQVPIFGIGLPGSPYLKLTKLSGTQINLHLLPIGAYAVIPELDPPAPEQEPLANPFQSFPLLKKILVVVSGIPFNILLGILLMGTSLIVLGEPVSKFIVFDFSERVSIARNAGVLSKDQITAIDDLQISNIRQITDYIGLHPERKIVLHLLRGGKKVDVTLVPNSEGKTGMQISTEFDQLLIRRYSVLEAIEEVKSRLFGIGEATAAIVSPNKGQKPAMHGLLSVIFFLGQEANDSRKIILAMALLSIDLGLLHLIPWFGTDAGHLFSVIVNHYRKKVWYSIRPLRWLYNFFVIYSVISVHVPICLLRGNAPKSKCLR